MIDIDQLRTAQTNGVNYDVSTDDIIARLSAWDEKYGVDTSDITGASVTVHFHSVPDDTTALAEEIERFCPDTVSQGYGCYGEMVGYAEEMGQDLDPKMAELIDGVDLEEDGYGLILLARALKRDKCIGLWWD